MTRDNSRNPARAPAPTFSPLYRQIKDFLIRSLESGEWGPGDAIPSEGELAQRFNVSQGTVRKAIDEMAAENMLVRRQGKAFVWTLKDGKSALRPVELGEETPIGYLVRGLAPDTPLLVVPQEVKLEEGRRIAPKER